MGVSGELCAYTRKGAGALLGHAEAAHGGFPRKGGGDQMAVSKAQQKAVNKYMAEKYDRINLTVPKGQRETIRAHAAAQGESVNGFLLRAIKQTMEQDSTGAQADN